MEQNFEFTSVEQMLADMAYEKKMPFSGSFELTPYCNLSCRMCYVKAMTPGLQLLAGDQWLEIGEEAARSGVLCVSLTGGEPLLHPDFKRIYLGLKKMGLVVSINTNGTLIDEEMADFFAKNMPRRVGISLYGSNREMYQKLCGVGDAFDQTIRALELLRVRGVPVEIKLTPNTINYLDMKRILDVCDKYSFPVQLTTYLFEPIRKTEPGRQGYRLSPGQMADVMFLFDTKRKDKFEFMATCAECYGMLEHFEEGNSVTGTQRMPCRAGASTFWIGWNGMMNICAMMNQFGADVCSLGFGGAWEKIQSLREGIRVPKRCGTCSLLKFCQSCAAVSMHENGDTTEIPEFCCKCTKEYASMMASRIRHIERNESERKES